jgi:hypothetical protein
MNANNIPDALREAASKLERHGYRYVRIAPNGPDPELGYTVYLCKRVRNGLRLAQVEMDADGNILTHR